MDEGYNKGLRYLMITLNNCLNLNDFIIALTRKFQGISIINLIIILQIEVQFQVLGMIFEDKTIIIR